MILRYVSSNCICEHGFFTLSQDPFHQEFSYRNVNLMGIPRYCHQHSNIMITTRLHNFSYGKPAMLLWHVQRFVGNWSTFTDLQQDEFSIEFDFFTQLMLITSKYSLVKWAIFFSQPETHELGSYIRDSGTIIVFQDNITNHDLLYHSARTIRPSQNNHHNDVIMGVMASQITSLTIVYSTFYTCADQRKYQSSASLAFVWGIHRVPVNSPHKWPVTRKMFPFDDVIILAVMYSAYNTSRYYDYNGAFFIFCPWKPGILKEIGKTRAHRFMPNHNE